MYRLEDKSQWAGPVDEDTHLIFPTPSTPSAMSGYSSMAWPYAVALESLGMTEEALCSFFTRVDTAQETGTFFPLANITVLPSLRAVGEEKKAEQLADALKAQDKFIKAKRVVFDFRFCDFDFYPLVIKTHDRRNNPVDDWLILTWQLGAEGPIF